MIGTRSVVAAGVVAAVLGAGLTVGSASGTPAPTVTPTSPSVTAPIPVPVPPAAPVSPKVKREALTPPAPAPDSAGAKQATSRDPLKLVAVTWTGAPPAVVQLRSRLATGAFGAWTRVDPVDAERDGKRVAATGSEPVWVADSREVQVRAVDAGGAPATERVALTSIDPQASTNDVKVAAAATTTTSPASPKVVTRAQWGADERKMTWAPEYATTVRAATIHHTAGTNAYTAAESAAIVRGIYAYHATTLGWGDIGYNALVDRFGTVFEGRAGGLARPVIAAHAGGFNRETFGVAMMGDYTSVAPPSVQLDATARISAWKLGGLYRDPRGTVTLTSTGAGTAKYPAGQAVTLPTVFAHRDVGRTECPGTTGYRSMATIRDRIAAAVGNLATNPIRTKWLALRSTLGEPSVVETAAANGGRTTGFTGGAVYWSSATGAWAVRGAILTYWTGLGAERSTYGYPLSDQYAVAGGVRQDFQNGSVFVATGSSTARRV